VGGGHTHRMHRPGDSPVHRLPAHVKVVALLGFVLVVVATPREQIWAFVAYGLLLAVVAAVSAVPVGFVLPRMLVEVPFVVFAVLLPLVATGPRVDVLGVSLSEPGLWGGWNVLAKGSLGVVASILLAATTEPRALLVGLQRLRVPALLVEIASFMVRYVDVVADEMRRMRIARESRGFQAGHLGHVRVLAQAAGALFIRSYERGERVHVAMLSRGYTGALPVLDGGGASPAAWRLAAALPVAALAVGVAAWTLA
jgi:cobalt/nickel transport system permease protein